jgi:orotate phosphoribosyltransferase
MPPLPTSPPVLSRDQSSPLGVIEVGPHAAASACLEGSEPNMLQSQAAYRHAFHQDDENRAKLLHIIQLESYLTGDFTLASGQRSNYFLDLKKTMFHPEGAFLASEIIYEMIKDDTDIEYIGGLEMGAVPIVVAVSVRSWLDRPLKAFFVRKTPKDHGTSKLIDGQFLPGSKVILVDDVTTTGGSTLKAAHAVREQGGTIKRVLTIVDRCEGATENLAREGLKLFPIFTINDISNYDNRNNRFNSGKA